MATLVDDLFEDDGYERETSPLPVTMSTDVLKISRKRRQVSKSSKAKPSHCISADQVLCAGNGMAVQEAENGRHSCPSLLPTHLPQSGEPLLQQIFDVVKKFDSKQQVLYEDLQSKVTAIDEHISKALDLWGAAGTVGDGCFNPEVTSPKRPAAGRLSVASSSMTDTCGSSGNRGPALSATSKTSMPKSQQPVSEAIQSRSFSARKSVAFQEPAASMRNTCMSTGSTSSRSPPMQRVDSGVRPKLSTAGILFVKIRVMAPGETQWRCPEEQSSGPLLRRTVYSPGARNSTYSTGELGSGRISVTLMSARGLRNADTFGMSDPYCVCALGTDREIREQFRTGVINDTLEPGWNEHHDFENFKEGDMLHFSVKDMDMMAGMRSLRPGMQSEPDTILGNCSLSYEQFFPNGFNGALQLTESVPGDDQLILEDHGIMEGMASHTKRFISKVAEQLKAGEERPQEPQQRSSRAGRLYDISITRKDTTLDIIMGIIITLNAVLIGINMDHTHDVFDVVDVCFTGVFILEMFLKLHLLGLKGYFGSAWHCFDFLIIVIDISQLILGRIIQSSSQEDIPSATMFRMLRLARLMRLLRLVNYELFEDLVAMITGIMGGMTTLWWAIVIVIVIVYITSLLFREFFGRRTIVMDCEECGDVDISLYFDSVPRSMLTVFRFFFTDFTTIQGVSLYEGIQTGYGSIAETFVCLLFFIVSIGVFNVITAIFVESTLKAAKTLEDTRMTGRLNNAELWRTRIDILIRKLMEKAGQTMEKGKSLSESLEDFAEQPVVEEEFVSFISDEDVVMALDDLEIDKADHRSLFDILDADNTGSISLCELINGLSRLRGHPRRSDIITIDLMVREVQQQIHMIVEGMGVVVEKITGENKPRL